MSDEIRIIRADEIDIDELIEKNGFPFVKITDDHDLIIFNDQKQLNDDKPIYEMDFRRIEDPVKFLGFLDHLLGKTWITTAIIDKLILAWQKTTGQKIHPF